MKIPTYVLIYHDGPTIRTSLDWLVRFKDRLELIVVENPSEHTATEIRPYVERLLARGEVDRYYLFDENVSSNALEVALRADRQQWEPQPYVLITDGDLFSRDEGWLDEEIGVLAAHADAFAIGISLDMSNLPVHINPAAVNWVPPPTAEFEDHLEGLTGLHLVLFRGAGLAGFLDHQATTGGRRFIDSMIHRYVANDLGQRWTRTKRALGYHITWDLYAQPDHPYARMKATKTLDEHWRHERYSGFTAYDASGARRHVTVA